MADVGEIGEGEGLSDFVESLIENGQDEVDVRSGEAHGRFDAEDVAIETAFADEEAEVAAAFEDAEAGVPGGSFGGAVFDQLDADHEAETANIPDLAVFFGESFQAGAELVAAGEGIFLETFLLNHAEDGAALGGGHGVAAKGVEVDAGGKGLGDLWGGDDGGEGEAVADAFGHGDDVGDDALGLEAPVVGAGSSEPGLDFVGDAEASGSPDAGVGSGQVALGEDHGTADALDGFGKEGGDPSGGGETDDVCDFVGVVLGGIGPVPSTAVEVGMGGVVNAESVGDIKLPRMMGGEAHGGLAAAVVAVTEGDDVEVARVGAGHEEGEVVGFRARVNEVTDLQVSGEFSGEFGGVESDFRVEINGGGVLEFGALLRERGEDFGMAMADADGDDSAEGVEVAPSGWVEEVLHPALNDRERFWIVVEDGGVEMGLAQGVQFGRGRPGVGFGDEVERGQLGRVHGGIEHQAGDGCHRKSRGAGGGGACRARGER